MNEFLPALEPIFLTITCGLFVFAGILSIILIFKDSVPLKKFHNVTIYTAAVCVLLSLIIRGIISAHFPLATLFESLLFTLFCTALLYIIINICRKKRKINLYFITPLLSVLAVLTLQLKDSPSPLAPVLRSIWLQIHVSVTMLSYAAFFLSFAFAVLFLVKTILPESTVSKKIADSDQIDGLSYKLVTLGYPLLMAGIITGAIWANRTWGSYWSWDPKETWALITWLIYTIYLHVRIVSKWRGTRTAVLNCIAFISVIITYFGVNLLTFSLHSYG